MAVLYFQSKTVQLPPVVSISSFSPEPPIKAVLTMLGNSIVAIPEEAVLVLDNYHISPQVICDLTHVEIYHTSIERKL